MAGIQLEIVTPMGVALRRLGVDKVVLRRHEPRFERGSQIVILPSHAPLLVRVADHTMRYVEDDRTHSVCVKGGYLEVLNDRVTVIVPEARPV